jgi:hypothetical protein
MQVTERIQTVLDDTKEQIAGIEKKARKRANATRAKWIGFEKKARKELVAIPDRVRDAWNEATSKLLDRFDFASRAELSKVGSKVDKLAKRVDQLSKDRVARISERVARMAPQK